MKFSERMKDKQEYILIAVVECEKGIYLGFRHSEIFQSNKDLLKGFDIKQGFLTSKNRFVGRKEAAEIAVKTKQVPPDVENLQSEDLY